MKMIFKDLYIFSPSEKLGKYVSFEEGVNIISSNQVDGANVGKSVIMRSLYYALGAEVFFESKFAPKWYSQGVTILRAFRYERLSCLMIMNIIYTELLHCLNYLIQIRS